MSVGKKNFLITLYITSYGDHLFSLLGILFQTDSAAQFIAASRPELADAEKREAEFLSTLLPPAMPESEIDSILRKIASEQNLTAPGSDSKRAIGILLKAFFAQVDKSRVDGQVVKQRAQLILEGVQQ